MEERNERDERVERESRARESRERDEKDKRDERKESETRESRKDVRDERDKREERDEREVRKTSYHRPFSSKNRLVINCVALIRVARVILSDRTRFHCFRTKQNNLDLELNIYVVII